MTFLKLIGHLNLPKLILFNWNSQIEFLFEIKKNKIRNLKFGNKKQFNFERYDNKESKPLIRKRFN